MILTNRHIGRFNLGLCLFSDTNLPQVRKLLAGMVIIEARLSVVSDSIEYTAISEDYFDEVQPGYEAPLYTFEINSLGEYRVAKS